MPSRLLKRPDKQAPKPTEKVLIPVDFSPKGYLALKVGFELARRLKKEVTLLHASVVANPTIYPQFPDDFNGIDNENSEIEEMELDEEVHRMDEKSMAELKKRITSLQKEGEIPTIKYDTVISPGMPEEVIAEYSDTTPPAVIVMATRGKDKRREELVGSVTAEVIDHCYGPVLTVPEDYSFSGFKSIVRICAFCYFDDGDFLSVSKLMNMFDNPKVSIFLFPATDKMKGKDISDGLNKLQAKLQKTYPDSEFIVDEAVAGNNLRKEAENLFTKESIQMILAPNRKRNAISRFFNPGLPHKILYEIDFPMLAIPV